MGTLEGTASGKPDHGGGRSEDGQTEGGGELARLQAGLAEAARRAPEHLATSLLADPARADLVAVLAQLEPQEALLALAQIAFLPVPDRHAVLAGLLTAGPSSSAQALRAGFAAQTRQALLDRIFSPTRVKALKRACRTLTTETT